MFSLKSIVKTTFMVSRVMLESQCLPVYPCSPLIGASLGCDVKKPSVYRGTLVHRLVALLPVRVRCRSRQQSLWVRCTVPFVLETLQPVVRIVVPFILKVWLLTLTFPFLKLRVKVLDTALLKVCSRLLSLRRIRPFLPLRAALSL